MQEGSLGIYLLSIRKDAPFYLPLNLCKLRGLHIIATVAALYSFIALCFKYCKYEVFVIFISVRDEADILGDRIAIMKSGRVKTSGSSLFLKKRSASEFKILKIKI